MHIKKTFNPEKKSAVSGDFFDIISSFFLPRFGGDRSGH